MTDAFLVSRLVPPAGRVSAVMDTDTYNEVDDQFAVSYTHLDVYKRQLYNCAAVCHKGELLGLVPKRFLPNYGEFYEARLFTPSSGENKSYSLDGRQVPFGPRLLFCCEEMEDFCFGVEICEDLWCFAWKQMASSRCPALQAAC